MTTVELIKKVRQLINENESDADVTLLTDDTRNLDEHITRLLPEAVLMVQTNARQGAVNPRMATVQRNEIVAVEEGVGEVPLPEDFVKLLSFKMNGWQRSCVLLYPAASQVAQMQSSPYTRGGVSRPVCVEKIAASGRSLLYYSLPSGIVPEVEHLLYEARFAAEEGLAGGNDALVTAVAYQCAALLYMVFERRDNAALMQSIAATLCGNIGEEKGGR